MSRPTDARAWPERVSDAQALALTEARTLCERHRADLGEGRCPAPELRGGHCGPCRPRVEYRSRGVGIALQTPAGHAADLAWHTYWREHEYRTLDAQLMAGAPARPSHEYHEWVWFSWAHLGRLHRDDLVAQQAPTQLQLAVE
ncbi:MAG: hypothetical protein MSC31_15145 [Solirubrobacteraceae bacterium MAG38_C4-C5]|nr:hypothetical protein [Candidatus Siliceabacter maunaloa]